MKRFLPIILFAAIAVALAVGLTRDPNAIPSALIDSPLPEFSLEQLDADAPEMSRADVVGTPFILNVFGSWCAACVVEHPYLMTLKQQNIRIFGLNWRDTRADASAWLARHGDPYTIILFDQHSDLAIELGVTGAPETFLVAGDGTILLKHVGAMDSKVWNDVFLPAMEGN